MDRKHAFIAIFLISMMCCAVLSENIYSGSYNETSPQTENDLHDFLSSKINNAILGFFYENLGQVDNPDIKFIGQTTSGILGFSENQINFMSRDGNSSFTLTFQSENKVTPRAEDESEHTTNFIHGNDIRFTGIRGFSSIVYSEVWSGITIKCTSTESGITIGFQISPYSDPASISIKTSPHEMLIITDESIVVNNDQTNIIIDNLEGYQDSARISANFIKRDTDSFGVNIDTGNSRSPINVESILHSESLGGSDFDIPYSLVLDDFGYAYVTGLTVSSDFLIENPLDSTFNGESDCFIFKIDLVDNSIQYSTFIGGSGSDIGTGISIDSEGNVYVTGRTQSVDFPMFNAGDSSFNGGLYDCFVLKLNSAGDQLLYSTFVGGSENDYAESIAVDSSGVVYVTGYTGSSDFPTVDGYDFTFNGGFSDTFVFKLDTNSGNLSYSTFLGGSRTDFANSISVDDVGCAYVAGYTYSDDFPVIRAADYTYNGYRDAIVYKLSSNGSQLVYSTFLGGNWIDQAESIAVDAHGNAIVTGTTYSSDFPTLNAYDDTQNGGSDCFVTAIGPAGGALLLSTFLGGTGDDSGLSISVDPQGYVYVSGDTESQDFPTESTDPSVMNGTSSTFITKFDISFDSLLYSTFLGGYLDKSVRSMAVDSSGVAFIAGYTTFNVNKSSLLGLYITSSTDVFVLNILDFGDSDFDGLADYLENELNLDRFSNDSDSDGFSDTWELNVLGTDPTNNDTDFDNLTDFEEIQVYLTDPLLADSDSDNLDDGLEVFLGTNPNAVDSDLDTLDDFDEVNIYGTNPLSSDTDMDTISDADEIELHGTDPLRNDTDLDEMLDPWELLYGLNPLIDDSLDDLDSDTLLNIEEYLYGTLPNNNDSDSDEINDGLEVHVYNTNPLQSDSDADTLSDFDEIFIHGTNATNSDSDSDLMPDNWEILHGLDALVDDSTGDPDSDTLSNLNEFLYGANPNLNDTDSDQIEDFAEIFTYGTSPSKSDSDSDTLSDYDEIMIHSTNPLSSDTDSDNLSDSLEILTYFTDPLIKDTDSDLMFDGWEVFYSLNPLVNDSADDEDVDQLSNLQEYLLGTNPQNNDTDHDLLDDFSELNVFSTNPLSSDSDNDDISDFDEIYIHSTDPNSDDSDNDTMFDWWEIQFGLNPLIDDSLDDLDSDTLLNIEEYLYGTLPNNNDSDSDEINDGLEVHVYNTNPLQSDSDADTLSDFDEIFIHGTNATNSDSDSDLMPDYWEILHGLDALVNDSADDPDFDRLLNLDEYSYGTNPTLNDTDDDQLDDYMEIFTYKTNATNSDSDFDSISDSWEIAMNLNPLMDDSAEDYDSDGLTNLEEFEGDTNPMLGDSDFDDLSDYDELKVYLTNPNSEDSDLDDLSDYAEVITHGTNPWSSDSDSDLLPDSWEVSMGLDPLRADSTEDPDSDGLTNLEEYTHGSNPLLLDSDSDELTDAQEIEIYGTNPSDSDSDNDALSDADEVLRYYTDPLIYDSDNDGIRDGFEITIYSTNPLLADTDDDSMIDGWEIKYGLDPLFDDSAVDSDNDGFSNSEEHVIGSNPLLRDSDGDEIDDFTEVFSYGTSPILADTDVDGVPDGWEILYGFDPLIADSHTDSDNDGLTELEEYQYGSSPLSSDSDSDGLGDFDEALVYHSNPTSSDSDSDGLLDFDEIMSFGTSPTSVDTDDDGMPDLWEVTNNLNATVNDAMLDGDSDGLTNLMEYFHRTDPNLFDSDDDGLNDFIEVNRYGTNPNLADSDSDGLSDLYEIYSSNSDPNQNDTDHDGLLDSLEVEIGTDPNSRDSDLDGIPDAWEYLNGYDPLNPDVSLQEFLHYHFLIVALFSVIAVFLLGAIYKRRR